MRLNVRRHHPLVWLVLFPMMVTTAAVFVTVFVVTWTAVGVRAAYRHLR